MNIINVLAYILPEKLAALSENMTGSGGLHMITTSWSDIMTTPCNLGNQILTLMKPFIAKLLLIFSFMMYHNNIIHS